MAARAIVTRYGGETLLLNGNFQIEWWALIVDPVTVGSQPGRVCAGTVELDAATPGSWAGSVETAVINHAAGLAQPFVLTPGTVFIPTIA